MLIAAHGEKAADAELKEMGRQRAKRASIEDRSSDDVAPDNRGKRHSWPWGTHSTKLLEHMAAAAEKFWKNYDPTDKSTGPTNDEVTKWLQMRGVSSRVAEIIAQILRADGLPAGRRKL